MAVCCCRFEKGLDFDVLEQHADSTVAPVRESLLNVFCFLAPDEHLRRLITRIQKYVGSSHFYCPSKPELLKEFNRINPLACVFFTAR